MLKHIRSGILIITGVVVSGIWWGQSYLPPHADRLIFPIAIIGFALVVLLNKFIFGKFLPNRGKPLDQATQARLRTYPTPRQLLIGWLTVIVTSPLMMYLARSGLDGKLLFIPFVLVGAPVFLAFDKLFRRGAPVAAKD